jgi:hypothetical protein
MEKSTTAFLLMFFLIVTFGCKKDKSESTTEVKPGLTVKFDGTTWTANVGLLSGFYYSDVDITTIEAGNTAGQQVQFSFEGNTVGTYNIYGDDSHNFGAFMLGMAEEDIYATLSYDEHILLGKIVITEYDKTNHTLSGTFYFDGYNSNDAKKTFSEGSFTKISYLILQ